MRRIWPRVAIAAALFAAVACGGGRPGPQVSGPGSSLLPGGLSDATSSPSAATGSLAPVVTQALPTSTPHAAPSLPPLAVPTGSLVLKMTAPVEIDVEVPADVDCKAGSSYHMDTGVTVDDYGIVVIVEIARYHGAGDYRATVTVKVTVDGDEDGGTVPGVPVTMKSNTKGFVEFSYSGGSAPVSGKITWICST